MIGRLTGILLEKNPPQLTLDVQGVAYEVDVPMSTFYNLPGNGERITLYTHLVVREDAHLLYGFGTPGGSCGCGNAPGRGDVSGPGCVAVGGTFGCGGMPGNGAVTGFAGCDGICTLIGSSPSSTGCGGRWNVGTGGAALAVAAGARLVARMVMRSNVAASAIATGRGAAM